MILRPYQIAKRLRLTRNQVIYLIRKHKILPVSTNPNTYNLTDFFPLRPYNPKHMNKELADAYLRHLQGTTNHVQNNSANTDM